MSDTRLRQQIIRLAHASPELRDDLLPLIQRTAKIRGPARNAPEEVREVARAMYQNAQKYAKEIQQSGGADGNGWRRGPPGGPHLVNTQKYYEDAVHVEWEKNVRGRPRWLVLGYGAVPANEAPKRLGSSDKDGFVYVGKSLKAPLTNKQLSAAIVQSLPKEFQDYHSYGLDIHDGGFTTGFQDDELGRHMDDYPDYVVDEISDRIFKRIGPAVKAAITPYKKRVRSYDLYIGDKYGIELSVYLLPEPKEVSSANEEKWYALSNGRLSRRMTYDQVLRRAKTFYTR